MPGSPVDPGHKVRALHTLYQTPDPARETQWLDPGRTDVAEFEVAIVRGKRD